MIELNRGALEMTKTMKLSLIFDFNKVQSVPWAILFFNNWKK